MSKELEKFRKTAKPFLKAASDAVSGYGSHTTNREHHKQILLECAKEVGRRAAVLKKNGKSGTTMQDFMDDKEIQQIGKTSKNALDSLIKEESRLDKILKTARDANAGMASVRGDLEKEIAKRKKKKDRKVLAVDSKSLPDMEKLSSELLKNFQTLRDDILMMAKSDNWKAATESRNFDKWTKEEIAKTGAARETRDETELGARGFDVRVMKTKSAKCTALSKALKTACAEGLKARQEGAGKDVTSKDATARKCLEEMAKILKPYDTKMKSMGRGALAGMNQSKDGKLVLVSVEQMRTQIKEGTALIKKVSRVAVYNA